MPPTPFATTPRGLTLIRRPLSASRSVRFVRDGVTTVMLLNGRTTAVCSLTMHTSPPSWKQGNIDTFIKASKDGFAESSTFMYIM
ncbi:hypothetical protein BJY01DRAFT_221757 [Aspergillus pseudoustus]|uniref:Uncharacterized protein n=1 Tax=Aspergillus pseudoustus TaxID=1810923 RepID=A0ABR4JAB6_9EURO